MVSARKLERQNTAVHSETSMMRSRIPLVLQHSVAPSTKAMPWALLPVSIASEDSGVGITN